MKIVINEFYGGFFLSEKSVELLKKLKNTSELDFYTLDRHDPHLVQVVEEMGKESWGEYSELAIVEIPDGLSYTIHEYDGMETVIPYIPVTIDELKNGLAEEKINMLQYTQELRLRG